MRSLIAEDDATNRFLLKTYLSKFGSCATVSNGQEAIGVFKSAYRERQGFDLVCMDLHMPVLDGHDTIRFIRQFEAEQGVLTAVRILVTTTLTDMDNITQALLGKCNAYLMKPIDLGTLHSQLQVLGLLDARSGQSV